MGRDKVTLPFGPESMLQRVVRLVGLVVTPANTIVVAGPRQVLPNLRQNILIAHDETEHQGPLAGLSAGLRIFAESDAVDAVYATGCDVPLLKPAFVERMFELLGENDAAVPSDGRRRHALAAVYRPRVLPQMERLLAADKLRAQSLFERIRTREVAVDLLREVDPQLQSLQNVNCEKDYLAAIMAAGLANPSGC